MCFSFSLASFVIYNELHFGEIFQNLLNTRDPDQKKFKIRKSANVSFFDPKNVVQSRLHSILVQKRTSDRRQHRPQCLADNNKGTRGTKMTYM